MSNPFHNVPVGILIPTRNRLHFLKEALQSALGQTYGRIKVIVIDNASDGGTAEYMAGIRDPRVSYIVNGTDIGLHGSINKGIGLMDPEIEWCTVLCDDDLLARDCVELMLRRAASDSAKAVVHCHRVFIDVGGEEIGEAFPAPRGESGVEFLLQRMKALRQTFLTGVLFKRNAFLAIGGYPEFKTGMASDDAFIFALSLQDRLVHEEETSVRIRFHEGAESQSFSEIGNILDTLNEFKAYCRRSALESGRFDHRSLAELERILSRYSITLTSSSWLQNLHRAIGRKDGRRPREMDALCSLAKSRGEAFSARVRFGAFCYFTFGVCPEASTLYRFLCYLIGPYRRARWRMHVVERRAKERSRGGLRASQ